MPKLQQQVTQRTPSKASVEALPKSSTRRRVRSEPESADFADTVVSRTAERAPAASTERPVSAPTLAEKIGDVYGRHRGRTPASLVGHAGDDLLTIYNAIELGDTNVHCSLTRQLLEIAEVLHAVGEELEVAEAKAAKEVA